jgi:putative flippase GtrA
VSVVSTVIGLTVLGVFVGVFGWPAVWANVMATVIALPPCFELSRRWVWAHDGRRSILRQAAPYAAVAFAGLIVSSIAVHLAANATINSTRLVHTVAVELANIAAYGSLWIVQFVVCDRILFRSRAKPTGGDTWNGASAHSVADGHNVPPHAGSLLPSEVMV